MEYIQRHLGRDARAQLAVAHHSLLGDHHPGPVVAGGRAGVGQRPASCERRKGMITGAGHRQFHFSRAAVVRAVAGVCAGLPTRAQHENSISARRWSAASWAGPLWHLNKRFRFPLCLARGKQQQNLRQPRPRAGVHGGPLFFVADPAFRRAGGVCVSKPAGLFAGQARGKRKPTRTRIHRAAADDVHRPTISARMPPVSARKFRRTRHPDAARATGVCKPCSPRIW